MIFGPHKLVGSFESMGHSNAVYINGSIEVALRNPNVYLETSGKNGRLLFVGDEDTIEPVAA